MPVAQVLGRIDQLEATLGQLGRTPPAQSATTGAASSSTSAGAAGLGLGSSNPNSGADFEAMMRVLDYADNLNNPAPAASGSSASSGSSSTSRSNGSSSAEAASAAAATGSTGSTNNASRTSSSSSVAPPSGTGKTGADAVEIGKKYLGVPYVWGGNTAATGLDCSGLTKLVYQQMGIDLPRVAIDQAKQGREIPSLAQAEPGDLIVTDNGGHIGIYVGDGKMLNAPRPGRDVSIDEVKYFGDIMTIRRLVDSPSEAAAAATAADSASSRRDFEARAGA